MNALRAWLLGSLVLVASFAARRQQEQARGVVRLAVVITPESSGLLQQLLGDFESRTGLKVVVDSRQDVFGLARDGKADLVLAHYGHGGTEAFCTEGLGFWPRPVFANQAALIGPASDPARIAG